MAKFWALAVATFVVAVAGQANAKGCSQHLLAVKGELTEFDSSSCTAKYGNFDKHVDHVHALISEHLRQSFLYSLVGSYFDTDVQNRFGFSKYMHDLGEQMWDDAIELVQYINKRGSSLAPNESPRSGLKVDKMDANLGYWSEVEALGLALDGMQAVAGAVHEMHLKMKDPAFEGFLESRFTAQHADKVRQLAGFLSNLGPMLEEVAGRDLALYLFDQSLA